MDWLIDTLGGAFGFLGDFLTGFANALISVFGITKRMYNLLMEFRDYLNIMTSAAQTGNFEGLPLHGAISTYRYLVGDLIFYFTYLFVMLGIMFTIYKLGCLIYKVYQNFRTQALSGSTSAAGFGSMFKNLFKF